MTTESPQSQSPPPPQLEQTQEPELHPLNSSWTLWVGDANEKVWSKKLAPLYTANTLESFWQYTSNIPPPGQVFFNGQSNATVGNKQIDEYAFFRSHITPKWEDPMNMDGGSLFVRKNLEPNQVDYMWSNALLGLIGETLDPDDVICGVRVVDKGSMKGSAMCMYRFELWFSTSDPEVVKGLKGRFEDCLKGADSSRHSKVPTFEFKKHK